MNDDSGLQVDMMPAIHGVRSFNSLRSRAEKIRLGGYNLWVASLADGRATKRCWGCSRRHSMKRRKQNSRRKKALASPRAESERAELDLIRRRLAMPMEKRMNFLRVRIPGGGSHL